MTEFRPLPLDSVISRDRATPIMSSNVYKVESYINIAHRNLQLGDKDIQKEWTEEGVECEVLMVGSTWKKGKVRIKIAVEFCEDSDTNTDELSILRSQI